MAISESSIHSQQNSMVQFESGSALDMAARLAEMESKLDLVQKFFGRVMKKDIDYGTIPGTPKPTLYKPGAEKLCELYNFTILIAEKEEEKDLKTGYYRAKLVIRLVHRGTGTVIAEGTGEANVYESKYRWRWVYERDLPRGIDKDALTSKEFDGRNGKFVKYRLENADLFDLWNTVLKMAKKRALVDATLSATRSSGIFSQAEDELDAWIEGEAVEGQQPSPQPQNQQPSRNASQGRSNPSSPGAANRGPSNPGAPASEKQIKAIFGAGKGKGLSSDDVKVFVYGQTQKDINSLSMGEASVLIGTIQNTPQEELKAIVENGYLDSLGDEQPPWDGGE